ncbi:hypothetical protein ACSDR0_31350, partial [Streptosporangium sp. G11]|uniref:hypothetical protein n=1 Tax=Streptosporangium sp. G11 TaxID=3436926 RepID=UPI003EB7909A
DSTSAGNHPRFSRPQGVRAATSKTEKRTVGGSTPPLTTATEQHKRPERISFGAFLISDDNVIRLPVSVRHVDDVQPKFLLIAEDEQICDSCLDAEGGFVEALENDEPVTVEILVASPPGGCVTTSADPSATPGGTLWGGGASDARYGRKSARGVLDGRDHRLATLTARPSQELLKLFCRRVS